MTTFFMILGWFYGIIFGGIAIFAILFVIGLFEELNKR